MWNSDWHRSRPQRQRCARLVECELLRSHDRIDIELRHSFDPHLVTKSGVKHDCRRMVGNGSAVAVIETHLFPNGAIFEPDYRGPLHTLNAAIDATYEGVQFGPCARCCL